MCTQRKSNYFFIFSMCRLWTTDMITQEIGLNKLSNIYNNCNSYSLCFHTDAARLLVFASIYQSEATFYKSTIPSIRLTLSLSMLLFFKIILLLFNTVIMFLFQVLLLCHFSYFQLVVLSYIFSIGMQHCIGKSQQSINQMTNL